MDIVGFLEKAVREVEGVEEYIGVGEVGGYEELPICLVVDKEKMRSNRQINESIGNQMYKNYKITYLDFSTNSTQA